jgi:hypothetical protein
MYYQRVTGPTYPKKVKTEIADKEYNFKLLRSFEIGTPCDINLPVEDEDKDLKAVIIYKRYKVNEEWKSVEMIRKTITPKSLFGKGKEITVLSATLPEQPPAGKIEYRIELYKGGEKVALNEGEPVVIRFKGFVPRQILIPHIIFMILALFFGTRTGVELIFRREKTLKYTVFTLISLGIGGLFLGPLVQYNAFGDYWTGWPFGGDWTDNKTLFAFIFWVISVFVLRRNPKNRLWPAIALIVMYSIYLIPHSTGGSELNPETGKVETGLKE